MGPTGTNSRTHGCSQQVRQSEAQASSPLHCWSGRWAHWRVGRSGRSAFFEESHLLKNRWVDLQTPAFMGFDLQTTFSLKHTRECKDVQRYVKVNLVLGKPIRAQQHTTFCVFTNFDTVWEGRRRQIPAYTKP